ncbi:MAG: hypothetical protein IPN33_18515 [Saprospiraceae bacterium]|nr:hypothetical protein [Saprospiraceae bacterium]
MLLGSGTFYTPNSAGLYYAQARSLNAQGCINPMRTEISLTTDPPAEVTIAPVTGTCVNNQVTLNATIGGAAASATWTASVTGGNFPTRLYSTPLIRHPPTFLVLSSFSLPQTTRLGPASQQGIPPCSRLTPPPKRRPATTPPSAQVLR